MRRLVVCLALLGGCGQSVNRTDGAVDAAVTDVSSTCTWRAGVPVLIDDGSFDTWHVDGLVSVPEGAWALLRTSGTGATDSQSLQIVKLDLNAQVTQRVMLGTQPGAQGVAMSIAFDPALGRGAVLHNRAGIARLDAQGSVTADFAAFQNTMGFSLGGYRDVDVTTAGITYLGEQARALWGMSMVTLNAQGGSPQQVDLDFPPAPFVNPSGRSVFPDHGFLAYWTTPLSTASPPASTLRVQRYDATGMPRTAGMQDIAMFPALPGRVVFVETPTGLLAAWEHPIDLLPRLDGVAVRILDANGVPRAPMSLLSQLGFYAGGLSALSAHGRVFLTAITGSGVLSPSLLVLDGGTGAVTQAGMPLPLPQGASRASESRVVATPGGLIVVFATDTTAQRGRAVAVPLACMN